MNIRVRFAPSPTGYLHIGGARTALFNWLYARHMGGKLVLRIEDTDAARNTREALEAILAGLHWLGIDWDEGPLTSDVTGPSKGDHGPYCQSQRQENYLRRVEALLSRDLAYEQDGAIRFRMNRDAITIEDLVCGSVTREPTDREAKDPDFVIVRSDGQPVFHLVNVIDDLEMGITHVIRGEDHLSNTPKHVALFRAFGVEPPRYGHIPLILNHDGSKMSKRDHGASIATYIDEGYAPEAVLNYLCLLGWSPKDDSQVLMADEVIKLFDLPQILRHNAKFDLDKLKWLNFEHIKRLSDDRFNELCVHALGKEGIETSGFPLDYIKAALDTIREKIKTFGEVSKFSAFYFRDEMEYDSIAAEKSFIPENAESIRRLRESYSALDEFNSGALESALKSLATQMGIKPGLLIHPARLACTGSTVGPSLYHLMEVLGKDRVLARLDQALARM